jgi:chromosome segregation ATPase
MIVSDDPITGLHRRFDKLESNFESIQREQHEISQSLVEVNHRIDLVEVQMESAHKREAMIVGSINDNLDRHSALVKKLFDKFDRHDEMETKERKERASAEIAERDRASAESKKTMMWLVTTCVSVLISIGMLMFTRVFE